MRCMLEAHVQHARQLELLPGGAADSEWAARLATGARPALQALAQSVVAPDTSIFASGQWAHDRHFTMLPIQRERLLAENAGI